MKKVRKEYKQEAISLFSLPANSDALTHILLGVRQDDILSDEEKSWQNPEEKLRKNLFRRCCAFGLVVAVDVVVFVAALVVDVVLVVRFYVVCVVADIAVVLPGVSGFLLEAVEVLFDVVGAFVVVVLFDVFGMLLDVAGLLVVGSGASADVVGVSVDSICRFVEGFATVLRPHIKRGCNCFR